MRCAACRRATPEYDIVHSGSKEGGFRRLCTECLNGEVAALQGWEKFQHPRFEPMFLTDCAGDVHEFHFRTTLFVAGVALDAFEVRDGRPSGYQLQVIGDPSEDLMVLLGRLIVKIRRSLARRHLEQGAGGLQIADHGTVRGLIDSEGSAGTMPQLVIDGREISWADFGRLLMSYEGWQFKLTISDNSEEMV